MKKADGVVVQLSGRDGNVFAIIGAVSRALKRAGNPDMAVEFQSRACNAQSYDEVLQIVMEYVEVT